MSKDRLGHRGVGSAALAALLIAVTMVTGFGATAASAKTGDPLANASSHPGITKKAIKIGLMTSLTGAASSSYKTAVTGVKAAFNEINKHGGIDGRKLTLVVVDDGSTATGALTATKSLITQGVFAIIEASAFFFGAYRDAVQVGIPVIGVGNDGPEWGTKANFNLFGSRGSFASGYPTFTTFGDFLKKYGVTELGVVAPSNSPSGQGTAAAAAASAKLVGIPTAVDAITQPLGSTDYTAVAIEMKNDGVNAVITEQVTSSNIAVLAALKNQGVTLKASFVSGGYQQALLTTKAAHTAIQGIDFQSPFMPEDIHNATTAKFLAALKTVGWNYPNPGEGLTFGYFPALAMIKGLEVAGKSPTWGSFITNLHKVTAFTATGLQAPVNFSKWSNVDPNSAGTCWYMSEVKGTQFVPLSSKPFCGHEVAGTTNGATSS